MFAGHAMLITGLTVAQMYCCGYTKPTVKVWLSVKIFIFLAVVVCIIYSIIIPIVGDGMWVLGDSNIWTWLELLYFVSYIKLIITFIKYMPQAWLNFRRKSTVGWSLYNILLDLTGGVLSIAQEIIDAVLSGSAEGLYGNPVKFGLSLFSICFDVIFIFQHFVLYRGSALKEVVDESSISETDEETWSPGAY